MNLPCLLLINRGPPNGPEFLDFYRQVQDSGRILHLHTPPLENIEFLVKKLDPNLLFIPALCEGVQQADELLLSVEKWSGK